MINNLEGWRHRPAMQFVLGTKQSQRSHQKVGWCSQLGMGQSAYKEHMKCWQGQQPESGSVSVISHNKTETNNEQGSALKHSTWMQGAWKAHCKGVMSEKRGKDGLVSAGKWANPTAMQTLIFSYREEYKWHTRGKKNSHLDMFAWSRGWAVRISCPRIWHSSCKTDLWGQGFPKDVMDRAWCWWRRRRENWASCSSFVSKNIQFQPSGEQDTV